MLALAGVAAASGLYGAEMRNVKVVTDQNGWVVQGKIFGVAGKIAYSDPILNAGEGGTWTYAYVGSEISNIADPSYTTTYYIRWGWRKHTTEGNWLLLTYNDLQAVHWQINAGQTPLPPPGDDNRYSFSILDTSPHKHYFFVSGAYRAYLDYPADTPILRGYKVTGGVRTMAGVEKAGSVPPDYRTTFHDMQWYKKKNDGSYIWKSWTNPLPDFQVNGPYGWQEDYHYVGTSDTSFYIWSSG